MGAELPTTRAAPAVAGLAPILMTSAATGLLLLALAWYLSSDANVDWYEQSAVLRWILIALTAVTLPHLILVSRCAHWLAAEHTSARP
jgi:hypothetical protein